MKRSAVLVAMLLFGLVGCGDNLFNKTTTTSSTTTQTTYNEFAQSPDNNDTQGVYEFWIACDDNVTQAGALIDANVSDGTWAFLFDGSDYVDANMSDETFYVRLDATVDTNASYVVLLHDDTTIGKAMCDDR